MISIFGNNKKPEPNKSKSIFNKSSGAGALRGDLKKEFIHMTDKTRYGHIMKPWEKAHLAEDLFPSKYGEHVSAGEVDKNRVINFIEGNRQYFSRESLENAVKYFSPAEKRKIRQ